METLRCKCGSELLMDSNKPTLTCSNCDFKYDIDIVMKSTADNGNEIGESLNIKLDEDKIMSNSKLIYGLHDSEDFFGMVWETELGKIITCEGKLNLQNNLLIKDAKTGDYVADIDLRNVLMSILPCK